MGSRIVAAALIGAACLNCSAEAQDTLPGDVTFVVPLNLTRLSPYIERVAVSCRFGDLDDPRMTLSMNQEIPVSSGQVVGDAVIVVPVDPYAALFKPAQTLSYECTLSGLIGGSRSGTQADPMITGWVRLDDKLEPSIALSPPPTPIKGMFVW